VASEDAGLRGKRSPSPSRSQQVSVDFARFAWSSPGFQILAIARRTPSEPDRVLSRRMYCVTKEEATNPPELPYSSPSVERLLGCPHHTCSPVSGAQYVDIRAIGALIVVNLLPFRVLATGRTPHQTKSPSVELACQPTV